MGNGEQCGSGGRSNWPVVLGGMVGGVVGGLLALLVKSFGVELGLWLGMIAFCSMLIGGIFLGQLAGSHVSRRLRDR